MTNRKFYRTFEELAQRKIAEKNAVCIEVTLVIGSSGVREQQDLIFEQLFDASFSLISSKQQPAFVAVVEEIDEPLSLEKTRRAYSKFGKTVHLSVKKVVDGILAASSKADSLLKDYWENESEVQPGKKSTSSLFQGISIKLGMKMLCLIPDGLFDLSQVASGSAFYAESEEVSVSLLLDAGVVKKYGATLRGPKATFNEHIVAAASYVVSRKWSLAPEWYMPYLRTDGAKRLHSDLMGWADTAKRNQRILKCLNRASDKKELYLLFKDDYGSDAGRCDLIDYALRSVGYSQNEISVDLLSVNEHKSKLSDSIGFLIRKSADLANVIGDIDKYLRSVAKLIWEKGGGKFEGVDEEEFFSSRIKTFYSNAYVCPELFLLEKSLASAEIAGKSRASVLPRLAGLPNKYRMSVLPAAYRKVGVGKDLFLVTISTPEERHHKHKEFAGKLRAIRYDFDNGQLSLSTVRFVAVIDGNWSEAQQGMLVNAGWSICHWNELSKIIVSI